MNGQNNFAAPNPPDFDKITWKCPCCGQERTDKFIKVASHDIGALFGHETGTMFVNCKYCADMPGCKEKAMNREWVLEYFFKRFQKDENYCVKL